MNRPNLVTFSRTDLVARKMEEIAKEFAEHFKVKRNYFRQFCKIFQNSKYWNIKNLSVKLKNWSTNFQQISGTNKIIILVQKAFNLCEIDKDISDLRGILVEALVIAKHGGSEILNDPAYGWGAKVYINDDENKKVIRYYCPFNNAKEKKEECGNRATIDFAFWNGRHGKFYECKVNPVGIGCKEIKYMDRLRSEFCSYKISLETFFVCAENEESIKMKLSQLGCPVLFKPMGVESLEV